MARTYASGTYESAAGTYDNLTFGQATLAAQNITRAGSTPVLAAASSGGDQVPVDGATFLLVNNGGAGSVVVTPETVAVDSLGNPSVSAAVTVAAGTKKMTYGGDDDTTRHVLRVSERDGDVRRR